MKAERIKAAVEERWAVLRFLDYHALFDHADEALEALEDAAKQGEAFEAELAGQLPAADEDPFERTLRALADFRDNCGCYPSSPFVPGGYRLSGLEGPDGFEFLFESSLAELTVSYVSESGQDYRPRVDVTHPETLPFAYDLAGLLLHDLCADNDATQRIRAELREQLSQAPWEHRLVQLESWTGAETTAAPRSRLSWSVSTDRRRPIAAYLSTMGKSGKWLTPKRVDLETIDWATTEHEMVDRIVADEVEQLGYPGSELWSCLERLVGHGRLVDKAKPRERTRLRRYRPTIRVEATDEALVVHIEFEGKPLDLETLRRLTGSESSTLAIHDGYFPRSGDVPERSLFDMREDFNDLFLLVDWRSPETNMLHLLGASGQRYPKAAFPRLQRVLERVAEMLPVEWTRTGRSGRVKSLSRAIVTASPSVSRGGITLTVLIEPHPGSGRFRPAEGASTVPSVTQDQLLLVERDFHRENARILELQEVLGPASYETLGIFNEFELESTEQLLPLITFAEQSGDFELRWDALKAPRVAGINRLSLELNAKENWFDIDGTVTVDQTQLTLRALLHAVRENKRFVRLDRERFAEVNETLAQDLHHINAVLSEEDRLSREGLLSVQETLEKVGDVRADEVVTEFRAQADARDPIALGEAFCAELRPYQYDGFQWLARMGRLGLGCILADDMGLGKTVQALAYLSSRPGPALVLAPTSVCDNWRRECEKFLPDAHPLVYRGKGRRRLLEDLRSSTVLIASYALLQRDGAALAEVEWGTVIFDEAQQLKNPTAKTTRSALTLRGDHRVALTGTPMENHLGELWSLFRVLAPGLLGSWKRFGDRFAKPIAEGNRAASASLAQAIHPYILRREKSAVAQELPPVQEILIDVELDDESREVYERVRAHAELHLASNAAETLGLEKRRFEVLSSLTRLRQVACSPRLLEPAYEHLSPKLTRTLEMLAELLAEERRVLVFSQFVGFLGLLREELDARSIRYVSLDGSTPAPLRQKRVDSFQAGEFPLFLISLKAGGTGLNLTAADTVIHLDPWWNPAAEQQATDRAHRMGQTNPVTVYKLVTRDTVEEKILRLQERKRKLVSQTLRGAAAAPALTVDDMLDLLRASIRVGD
ncbi:MAG: DEAD/DEAH box helicase [Myxococcota bacterium]